MRAILSHYDLWSALFGQFFALVMLMCIGGWMFLVDLPLRAVAGSVHYFKGRLG